MSANSATTTSHPILDQLPSASYCAGLAHDLGKACAETQAMLRGSPPEPARHEWVSAWYLSHLLRQPFDSDPLAWIGPEAWSHRAAPEAAFRFESVADVVAYATLTHHRLPDSPRGEQPDTGAFLRAAAGRNLQPPAWALALSDPGAKADFGAVVAELRAALPSHQPAASSTDAAGYYALGWLVRALLVLADHQVSAEEDIREAKPRKWDGDIWANTTTGARRGARKPRQTLRYHLSQVGAAARAIATEVRAWLLAPRIDGAGDRGLPSASIARRVETDPAAPMGRYAWQARALASIAQVGLPGTPTLLLVCARTGSGKTRFGVSALATLSGGRVRVSIALPLRQLTHQTGSALRTEFPELKPADVLCVTGEHFYTPGNVPALGVLSDETDEDGNLLGRPAPSLLRDFDGRSNEDVPDAIVAALAAQAAGSTSFVAAPILVSTIDQLLHAGDPTAQGAHGVSLLRLLSADLILDEVDAYPPDRMASVLRLITWAAVAGRNVVCCSGTLSGPVARACAHAHACGIARRAALLGVPPLSEQALIDAEGNVHRYEPTPEGLAALDTWLSEHSSEIAAHGARSCAIPMAGRTSADWLRAVAGQIVRAHNVLKWTSDAGTGHSAGVVRVAHIRDAIAVARGLATHLDSEHAGFDYRLCVLHGQLPLAWRTHIESRLAAVLCRKGDDPFNSYMADASLRVCSGPLIVVATSVIESGSDLCFDWAIADAWSWHSFHQLRGRVMRHRTPGIEERVFVPQWSIKHCRSAEQYSADGTSPYWRPGNLKNPPRRSGEVASQVSLLGLDGEEESDRGFLALDEAWARQWLAPDQLEPLDGTHTTAALTASHYRDPSARLRDRPTWRMERWAAVPSGDRDGSWDVLVYCTRVRRWVKGTQLVGRSLPADRGNFWPAVPARSDWGTASEEAWVVHAPTMGAGGAEKVAFHGRLGFGPYDARGL